MNLIEHQKVADLFPVIDDIYGFIGVFCIELNELPEEK